MNQPRAAAETQWKLHLPRYPKAFVAAAHFPRERDRVFVAMPFEDEHSEVLWRVIQGVCAIRGLNARRADDSPYPRAIVADILEELERAEIIIADLTNLNANVLYEVGIAHVRCDSVVLLAMKGQDLPFDLADIRCIFFDVRTKDGQVAFAESLGKTLDAVRMVGPPVVVDSTLQRTELIRRDLETLASYTDEELSRETVWFSGFLSAFAISFDEPIKPEELEYQKELLREREALLNLARRGCLVRCIISPPSTETLRPSRSGFAKKRLKTLLQFLESGDQALQHIEWAISRLTQKSLYIIGSISYFEGYKRGTQRGFGLTLRGTGRDAISGNISLYEALFEHLKAETLAAHGEPGAGDARELLRKATAKCVRESLAFCESL